jgi:hypothetical protein
LPEPAFSLAFLIFFRNGAEIMAKNPSPPDISEKVEPEQVSIAQSLEGLTAAAGKASPGAKALPPVEQWNPPFCGDIDMRIARDGTWFYNGTPIGRPALVRLFSTILRKDPDRYVLVTPVEKVGIKVEDAPFLGVELTVTEDQSRQVLAVRTNVEDWVTVDAEHPLRFAKAEADGIKPYVRVRGDLWALVTRSLFLDLVALGEIEELNGERLFGVRSCGTFFTIANAQEIEEFNAL